MHPSLVARRTIGSNVRRRSVGGTVNHASGRDSFPSVKSQPIVSLTVTDDSTNHYQSRIDVSLEQLGNHLLSHSEDDGYHVYGNLSTTDEASYYSGETRYLDAQSPSTNDIRYAYSTAAHQTAISAEKHYVDDEKQVEQDHSNLRGISQSPENANITAVSFDSGHYGIIPAIGTTDKFIHKWPLPKTLKYFEPVAIPVTNSLRTPEQIQARAPEEGQGLGLIHLATWTSFKWCLFFSIITLFACGCAGMISAIMTWVNGWDNADVMVVADRDILVLVTLASCLFLFTSFLGFTGTILNSRPILAAYTLLLWPTGISLLAIGYTSYRRTALNFDRKLTVSWSRSYSSPGRLLIQDALQCCGYYSSMHEAIPSKRCYLRTPLPGCKNGLLNFEIQNLRMLWKTAFALAPLHLLNMVVALLCSNHVTNKFGKGLFPMGYRLSAVDVKADAEKIVFFPGVDLPSPLMYSMDDGAK